MAVVRCMKKIKIGSFNTWNNVINRRGITFNVEVLSQVIKEENFDIIGTQELTLKYCNELRKGLSNYSFCGNYRFGDFIFKKFSFNENNSTPIIEPLQPILDEEGMRSICLDKQMMWDKINEIVGYINQ